MRKIMRAASSGKSLADSTESRGATCLMEWQDGPREKIHFACNFNAERQAGSRR
jgi:hypothetical protein